MVRWLPSRGCAQRTRRAALPPEALLTCLLVASPGVAGGADASTVFGLDETNVAAAVNVAQHQAAAAMAAAAKVGGVDPVGPGRAEGAGTSLLPGANTGSVMVVARPGDSLSSLAGRYLGATAAWPRVWAANPHLGNPNVLAAGTHVVMPAPGGPLALAHNLDVPEKATVAMPPPRPRPNLGHALWPRRDVARLGHVVAPLGDSTLARPGERLAVRSSEAAPFTAGARYVTLAVGHAIGEQAGSEGGEVLMVTGVARALGGGAETELVLEQLVAEVEAGQRLAPLASFIVPPLVPAAAPPELRTVLLGVERDALGAAGGKLAFVAAGSRAGLAPGMRLWFVEGNEAAHRPQAGAVAPLAPMPPFGELRVLAVQDTSATCAIVRSGREVGRGQTVVGAAPRPSDAPEPH